ncbi:chorismate--pyruvate lyase family protein [Colwellia psychrerythraea]|uniref:Probable chorismate pyruvate-lyase n=1 Tax=Colwellia psychrerythraea TaxID=28229 RepID=A0A099L3V0_COLPS|nr:chorismate lyase [Colwellia psychrerythraea]KGJ97604.1 Chorismate--pyruvate lyase [Colwellia psychrerythraea]
MTQKTVNFPINFPVTLSGQWQSPSDAKLCSLSVELKDWLLDEGSLTARLKSHCDKFKVRVIGEKKQLCSAAEACHLIKAGEAILVREVLLYCDDVPQVFARSLLPLTSLTGNEQDLANLGEQPLGQVIFNNPTLQRQRLELSSFNSDSSVAILASQLTKSNAIFNEESTLEQELWGRRSIFVLDNKPLMVAEVFLPGAFAYQEKSGFNTSK